MWLWLVAWLLGVQTAPLPVSPVNADFEQGVPAGWNFVPQGGPLAYRFEAAPGRSGQGGHIFPSGAVQPSSGAMLNQAIDARPWRGKRIRFAAALKVARPGASILMFVTVLRAQGATPASRSTPVRATEGAGWTEIGVDIRVADDAETIWIGLGLNGDVDLMIDDVTLSGAPPAAPASAEADAYLMRAIGLIRTYHIYSARADWPRIIADARNDISGAVTTADTYPAISEVLVRLGERHSSLRVPASVASGGYAPGPGGAPPEIPMPTAELVEGRFGVVRLPALGSSGPQGEERSARYTATLRGSLEALDKAPLCGWIVDLRENGGGNMWPMLNGLDPLLGRAPFGWFIDPRGQNMSWQRVGGRIISAPTQPLPNSAAFLLRHGNAPLAILLGPHTASSGEMTAVALTGRPGVRSFGSPSAGYTTSNSSLPLSDGAMLVVTSAFIRDRTGKDYAGPMIPDVPTAAGAEQAEAIRWLATQCPAA